MGLKWTLAIGCVVYFWKKWPQPRGNENIGPATHRKFAAKVEAVTDARELVSAQAERAEVAKAEEAKFEAWRAETQRRAEVAKIEAAKIEAVPE